MSKRKTYLTSADGYPMKYIRANTAAEARAEYKRKTGLTSGNPTLRQVLGRRPRPRAKREQGGE